MLPSQHKYSKHIASQPSIRIGGKVLRWIPDKYNQPYAFAGGFGIVFKLKDELDNYWALKCFSKSTEGLSISYKKIQDFLDQINHPILIPYQFIDNGIEINGDYFPILLMEWVEGKTLALKLKEVCNKNDTNSIGLLKNNFLKLALWLLQQEFAHHDLKPENIVVKEDFSMVLIDYDGMYVPEMSGELAREFGTGAFIHPDKTKNQFDRHADDFAIVLISLALCLLHEDASLYEKTNSNEDALIFNENDFLQLNNHDYYKEIIAIVKRSDKGANLIFPVFEMLLNNQLPHELLQDVLITLATKKIDAKALKKFKTFAKQYPAIADCIVLSKYPIKPDLHLPIIGKASKKYLFEYPADYQFDSLLNMKEDELKWRNQIDYRYYYLSQNPNIQWTPKDVKEQEHYIDWFLFSRFSSFPAIARHIELYRNKWEAGIILNQAVNQNTLDFDNPFTDYQLKKIRSKPKSKALVDISMESNNKSRTRREEFIEKYVDKWDWEFLSENTALPWSEVIIEKYEDKWNWSYLSWNNALPWSEVIIEKYEDNWDWNSLSENVSLPWSKKFIQNYEDRWDWDKLSENYSLPWSEGLIEKFENKWNWISLSRNGAVLWSEEFIIKFEDKWSLELLSDKGKLPWSENTIFLFDDSSNFSWYRLSDNAMLPWSEEFIEKYVERWDWDKLSDNYALPWSEEFIEKFEDKWNWEFLSCNKALPWSEEFIFNYMGRWCWDRLSYNKTLPLSEEFIMKFEDKWSLELLSDNEMLPWSEEFIEKLEDKWDWNSLSRNEAIPWSEEFIIKFEDKWNWEFLSDSKALLWSEGFILLYEDNWDWNSLSENVSLPWSKEFIQNYEDRWDWDKLSENYSLPWSVGLMEKFEDKWDWEYLSRNEALSWSEKLIQKYEDKWDWNSLSRNKSLPWSNQLGLEKSEYLIPVINAEEAKKEIWASDLSHLDNIIEQVKSIDFISLKNIKKLFQQSNKKHPILKHADLIQFMYEHIFSEGLNDEEVAMYLKNRFTT